jgi:hypothetical protein
MNQPMKAQLHSAFLPALLAMLVNAPAQDARIDVRADQVLHPVSRYLTGACIEDVNHEIYGGIYSQMIFGESFQEPAPPAPLRGFTAYGGRWIPQAGELAAETGDGPKLLCAGPAFAEGEVSVELFFPEQKPGNAGLIVKVSQPGLGADRFTGYEVALETSGRLVLGRHRQNWEPIRTVPCAVPIKEWLTLTVRMTEKSLEVLLNGKSLTQFEDTEHPLASGSVGLRTWQREARFRNLVITTAGTRQPKPFELSAPETGRDEVSAVWRAVRRGAAEGDVALETQGAFAGRQSQRLSFIRGSGEVGLENQGLNRWGLFFAGGKPYQGRLWARAPQATEVWVALESADGAIVHAEKRLRLKAGDWQYLEFSLRPKATEAKGRFAIKLKQPGSVTLGYAFLQPGPWGRFKGLPVRRDVAEGLIDQGITVLRYGGSMVNHPEYRWKKMIGPRDRRPPYTGTWYPHSSNGWGILDFMDFCEAAGFEYVPAFFMGESPQDMADFIKYAKGPARSEWGRKRAADGHPAPYRLKYIELGNEERVDEAYWQKFKPMAEAVWAQDPDLILVVGDFFYNQVIQDPFNFGGGAVKTLVAHKKILDLAREHGREVWFDIHIGTEQPPQPGNLAGERSFIEQLGNISPGAKYKVVIFEFNAGNHSQKRALANALAINLVERDGRLPIATSANCLQPDGQNDNDWNQGLLFLNPSQVWLQPPGYVTQMYSRNYLPQLASCEVTGEGNRLDANAKRSEDGRTLVLQVVNPTGQEMPAQIHLAGFAPKNAVAQVVELSGPLEARNTAAQPGAIVPQSRSWSHGLKNGQTRFPFRPNSVTVLRFE